MYDEDLLDRIRDYYRRNLGTYTAAALRERLIRDGVPADAVDRVAAEMNASPYLGPPPSPPPASGRKPSAGVMFLVLLGGIVVNVGVAAGAVGLAAWANSAIPLLLVPLALVGEIVGAVVYGRKNPAVTVGLVVAVVLTPVVVVVLAVGACFAIIASLDGNIGR